MNSGSARRPGEAPRDALGTAFGSLLDLPAKMVEIESQLAQVLAQLAVVTRALPPALVSVRDAARHLGVSVPTVRRLVKAGRLPAVRVGGSVRIDLARVRPVEEREVVELAASARATDTHATLRAPGRHTEEADPREGGVRARAR